MHSIYDFIQHGNHIVTIAVLVTSLSLSSYVLYTGSANGKAVSGDLEHARQLARASIVVSTVGVVVSVITLAVYFGTFYEPGRVSCTTLYEYKGGCYRYFSSYVTSAECSVKHGVYYHGYHPGCYYN